MDLKKHVSAFIESFKGNKGEEFANLLQEPLNKMVEGIEAEVSETLQNKPEQTAEVTDPEKETPETPEAKPEYVTSAAAAPETSPENNQPEVNSDADLSEKILNHVTEKFGERISALETANANLKKENETLKEEVINKIGGAVRNKSGDNKEPKQIGFFTKREN